MTIKNNQATVIIQINSSLDNFSNSIKKGAEAPFQHYTL